MPASSSGTRCSYVLPVCVAPDALMLADALAPCNLCSRPRRGYAAPRSPDAPVAVMLAVSRPRERSTAGPVLHVHVGSAVALGVHLSVHCVSFDDRAVYCSFQKQTSHKNKLRLQG